MLKTISKQSGKSVVGPEEERIWEGFAEKEGFQPGEKE